MRSQSMFKNSQHARASISTYHGVEFFPLAPRYEDVYVEDVAHALSNTCRYAGHTLEFYSVAQHCVHVAEWLEREIERGWEADAVQDVVVPRWGLLHDASEAYIADICAPIKPFIVGYREIEEQLQVAIGHRFGLPWPMPSMVKYADKAVFKSEVDSGIMRRADWWVLHPEHPDAGMRIEPWDRLRAESEFIRKFRELFGDDAYAAHRRP